MPHRHSAPRTSTQGRAAARRHGAPAPLLRRRQSRWPLASLALAVTAVMLVAMPTLSGAEEQGRTSATSAPSSSTDSSSGAASASAAAEAKAKAKAKWRAKVRAKERAKARWRAKAAARAQAAASAAAGSSSTGSSSTGTDSTGTDSTGTAPTTDTVPSTPDTGAPAATSGGSYLPYSADSYFRSALPDSTPASPESAAFVAHAKANEPFDYLKIRGVGGNAWGMGYALADCSDPVYKLAPGGTLPASQEHLRTVGFHAPASLWQNIPDNSDAPFLVIDQCGTSARPGGLSVWGRHPVASGQTITTSLAGAFAHDTNGLDRRNPLSDSQLNERSRGVIPDSMLIRLDLLEHAIRNDTGLGHVLEVFWMETNTAAGFVHPMVGEESGKSGVGAEGQRLRIRADIDLASRPGCSPSTNPVGLAIARTLQQHGGYLGDNSGAGSGIKTEQGAQFPGLTQDSLKGCMTWDDVVFLPAG